MKRIAIALLASAAALAASSARASTRVSIGVNVRTPVYTEPVYAPAPPVVYAPAPSVTYAPPAVVIAPPAPRGYWKDVVVKTWVPERWVTNRDRWGRSVRVCEPGYYAYRTDRVWVDGRDHDHGNHYGRDGRDGNYGYGNTPSYGYNGNNGYNGGWHR